MRRPCTRWRQRPGIEPSFRFIPSNPPTQSKRDAPCGQDLDVGWESSPGCAHWRFFGVPLPPQRSARKDDCLSASARVTSLQRSEEVQGRKRSSARREVIFTRRQGSSAGPLQKVFSTQQGGPLQRGLLLEEIPAVAHPFGFGPDQRRTESPAGDADFIA